jgi:hypothetical protein
VSDREQLKDSEIGEFVVPKLEITELENIQNELRAIREIGAAILEQLKAHSVNPNGLRGDGLGMTKGRGDR